MAEDEIISDQGQQPDVLAASTPRQEDQSSNPARELSEKLAAGILAGQDPGLLLAELSGTKQQYEAAAQAALSPGKDAGPDTPHSTHADATPQHRIQETEATIPDHSEQQERGTVGLPPIESGVVDNVREESQESGEPLSGERLKQFEDDRIQELQATGILEQRELSREQLEATIQSLEKELGIESPLDRVVEAGLLIDKKFLDTALITGQDRAVERMFGDAAWADWLSARVDAKYYSGEPLSADFIKSLHSSLAKYSNRELGGIIRKNGILGGDYKDLGRPVTYTAEQLTAIADQGHCILNLTKRSFLVDDEIT